MKKSPVKLGEVKLTERGFERLEFKDRSNILCRLQASSLAEYEKPGTSAIWLGPVDANPQVMASQAAVMGMRTDETTGWIPYAIPKAVLLTTEMHLNRKQVEALINHLQAWLDTDTFEIK